MPTFSGQLIIFSGPSGAGKTTVLQRVLDQSPRPLVKSVSATTRPPRPGEIDNEDYYFLSDEEFQRRRAANEFLESFEVFGRGYWYGTFKSTVTASLNEGQWLVLEIDVQGRQKVIEEFPQANTFFVRPPSLEVLEQRLRQRGTENEEAIQRRLEVARHEWQYADQYTYEIINDSMQQAVDEICQKLELIGEEPL